MNSQAYQDEPTKFVQTYIRENGLQGDLSSTTLRKVIKRAEIAREKFKSERNDEEVVNHAALTQSEKYRRRLENNKKSAAATRVFNEILRKESARVMRDLELQLFHAEQKLAVVSNRLQRVEQLIACQSLTRSSNVPLVSDQSVSNQQPSQFVSTTLRPLNTNVDVVRPSPTLEPQPRELSPLPNRSSLPFLPLTGAIQRPRLPLMLDTASATSLPPLQPSLLCDSKANTVTTLGGGSAQSASSRELSTMNRLGDVRSVKRARVDVDENLSERSVARRMG